MKLTASTPQMSVVTAHCRVNSAYTISIWSKRNSKSQSVNCVCLITLQTPSFRPSKEVYLILCFVYDPLNEVCSFLVHLFPNRNQAEVNRIHPLTSTMCINAFHLRQLGGRRSFLNFEHPPCFIIFLTFCHSVQLGNMKPPTGSRAVCLLRRQRERHRML